MPVTCTVPTLHRRIYQENLRLLPIADLKQNPNSWHVGGGMEFKFNPYTGIFADARRVFPDETPAYTLVRAGLRVGF